MRKLFYLLFSIAIVAFLSSGNEAYGQMNRRSIKRNNKRISHYKGKKSHFGKDKRYNTVGFSLSALNYFGDLSPKPSVFSTDISFTRPAIGISFSHRFGPRYSLTGTFMYGTLKGADNKSADEGDSNGNGRYHRNLSFRNRIKEFSIVANLDLFQNMSTYISRVKWTPYAFLGIAGFFHNPQAKAPEYQVDGVTPLKEHGEWVDLQPLGTEGQHADLQPGDANYGIKKYHKFQPAIPFGIGVRLRLNQVLDFAAEFGFRYTFTDYLDDVSKNYVDLGVFKDNELAKAMSYRSSEIPTKSVHSYQGRDGKIYTVEDGYGAEYRSNNRGDKKDKDIYMVTTFKLTYIVGKTFHRAKFR